MQPAHLAVQVRRVRGPSGVLRSMMPAPHVHIAGWCALRSGIPSYRLRINNRALPKGRTCGALVQLTGRPDAPSARQPLLAAYRRCSVLAAEITRVTHVHVQLPNVTRMLNLDLDDHPDFCETPVTIRTHQFAIINTGRPCDRIAIVQAACRGQWRRGLLCCVALDLAVLHNSAGNPMRQPILPIDATSVNSITER